MGEIDYLSYGFAAVVLGGGLLGFIKAGELVRVNWEGQFPLNAPSLVSLIRGRINVAPFMSLTPCPQGV